MNIKKILLWIFGIIVLCIFMFFMTGFIITIQSEYNVSRDNDFFWFLVFGMIIITIAITFNRVREWVLSHIQKKNEKTVPVLEKPNKEIDYRKEAQNMIEQAKKLFSQGEKKDAYAKAAEAIRFYYSHKMNIKTELTNMKLVELLKKQKVSYERTQKCLNLTMLVEFAKYTANKKDFDEIIRLATKIIG